MPRYLMTFALSAALMSTSAFAAPRFWVVNRSSAEIRHVYAVSKDGYDSADLLGPNGAIESGDQVQVLSSPGDWCVIDVRVETSDDQGAFFENFNSCTGTLYVRNKALESID